MKIGVYCIYKNGEKYPCKILGYPPNSNDLSEEDKVCNFIMSVNEPSPFFFRVIDITFDEDKEWCPPNVLFNILEIEKDGKKNYVGSDQGYSLKKARSIVENLLIAYPYKTFKVVRKEDKK